MSIIEKIKNLIIRYKGPIAYLFFGVCSTVVNILSYALCYRVLHLSNVISTVISWFFAVSFAFVTNKLWVFESKSFNANIFLRELKLFFLCRVFTGILDVSIMYVSVDVFSSNEIIWKCISNLIVIFLNYIFSKLMIFKSKS